MPAQGAMLNDRYRLEKVLGEGGMGRVWQAYDTELGRSVAIKEVREPSNTPPEAVAKFYQQANREARNAARVSGIKEVVTVFDVFTGKDGRPWIIMDLLLDHLTLQQHIEQHGVWTPNDLATAAGRLLGVVHQIHIRGIVHRDFKPANLMVSPEGEWKILDFGIAQNAGDTRTSDNIVGTVAYMAPEYLNNSPATPASDAWSLGVVLYYALTGISPFQRDTPHATMVAIMQHNHSPLQGDDPIHVVTRGLLRENPDERLPLDQAARMLGATETVLLSAPPTPGLRKRPKTGLVAAGVITVVIAIVAGLAWIPWGQDNSDDNQATSGAVTAAPSSVSSAPSSPSAPVTTAPVLPTAQVVGNVYTSSDLRVEAPAGWNISAAPETTGPEANLYKDGEGYVRITRLNGSSQASLVQAQRDSVTSPRSPLSTVSYPQSGMALWSYSLNRFHCIDFPCGTTFVWSTVVAVDGGYVAITYNKQAKGDLKDESDNTRALAAIRATVKGIKLL